MAKNKKSKRKVKQIDDSDDKFKDCVDFNDVLGKIHRVGGDGMPITSIPVVKASVSIIDPISKIGEDNKSEIQIAEERVLKLTKDVWFLEKDFILASKKFDFAKEKLEQAKQKLCDLFNKEAIAKIGNEVLVETEFDNLKKKFDKLFDDKLL